MNYIIAQSKKHGKNKPKMNLNEHNWQFLGYTKGPNEGRNTNTKFPD